jgi:hypothetical protein
MVSEITMAHLSSGKNPTRKNAVRGWLSVRRLSAVAAFA